MIDKILEPFELVLLEAFFIFLLAVFILQYKSKALVLNNKDFSTFN